MGYTSLGPFCVVGEQETSLALLQSCPGQRHNGRCPAGVMEQLPGVCLPSHPIHTTSSMEHPLSLSLSHPDCINWPRQFWFTDLLKLSVHVAGPSNTAQGQVQARQSRTTATQGLVFEWVSEIEHSCSTRVQYILNQSRKVSTRSCYSAKWKSFSSWAH